MSVLKGTIPLVEIHPIDAILGSLLGGIRKTPEGYEYQPVLDWSGRNLIPLDYELVKSNHFNDDHSRFLSVNFGMGDYHDESNIWTMDKKGHLGEALMRLNNISWTAIEKYKDPPVAKVRDGSRMRPFWEIEGEDASGTKFPLYITFPREDGLWPFRWVIAGAVAQRDYAFAVCDKEQSTIAFNNIMELAKRPKPQR